MPHPDEHIDDLLRKAAEGHGIKTGTDRWNEISSALEKPAKRRRYGWLLWLPALLLGAGLSGWFAHEYYTHTQASNEGMASPLVMEEISKKQGDTTSGEDITKSAAGRGPALTNAHNSITSSHTAQHQQTTNKQTKKSTASTVLASSSSQQNLTRSFNEPTNYYALQNRNDNNAPGENFTSLFRNHFTVFASAKKRSFNTGNYHGPARGKAMDRTINTTTIVSNVSDSKFYLRLQSGLQFSSVAMQQRGALSPTFGVLLGRKFNNKWSAEIGVQAERLRYTTSGNKFAMKADDMGMPSGSEIMTIDGESNLLSVPVRINRVVSNTKSGWQTGVGASLQPSVLTRESNDYHAQTNGQPVDFKGLYTTKKLYAAGMLGVHASISPPSPGRWRLHAEPFLKIPLQKMGVGKLPLATAGLQIAATIPFKKH